jgi:hypothetical protein|tara:strand:+ start:190 stop:492 length:303 start_codon:yes stop_codon:yes gene_type:complete
MAGPAEKLYLRADAEIVAFLFLVVAFAAPPDDFKKRLRLCIEDFPKNDDKALPPRCFWVDLTASKDEKCCAVATRVVVIIVFLFRVRSRVAVLLYVTKAL